MIASLRGRLLRKEPNRVVIEAAGVGYAAHVPLSTFFSLGEPGAEVALLVHTHVREDALQLFGFATRVEQAVFERLIEVSGIGPKMAVTILSGIGAAELVVAIREGDVKRLTGVPGVGKRLSERLVVELRDKLDPVALELARPPAAPAGAPELRDDAVSALVNLGYRRKDAEAAVERAAPGHAGSLETLLRAALAALMR